VKKRYEKNIGALTVEENERLMGFRVCVVGCGGLGGFVIEQLGRLGVGFITAVDGDVFEETNLNRQLFSDGTVLGINKAKQAQTRMRRVNPDVNVTAIPVFVVKDNCEEIVKDHDIIIDALDNVPTRYLIESAAQKLNIPLIHGAISGWCGQVCVIKPGHPVFNKIYQEMTEMDSETDGNLPYTAGAAAAIEASEAVKVLLGKENTLEGKFLTFDLQNSEFEIFDL